MLELNEQNQYRGEFISSFALLERSVDLYLATYFAGTNSDKVNDLIDIIIDRIPFGEKRNALKLLIDKRDEQDFKAGKHGNKKINHKIMLEEIRQLAVIRNHFAHYGTIHNPDLSPDIAIQLFQQRDGSSVIEYTMVAFDKFIIDINRLCVELIRLREESFGVFNSNQ